MTEPNGRVTLRDVYEIVQRLEDNLRRDVRDLAEAINRIDRQGSIGTRDELREHDKRIEQNTAAINLLQTSVAVAGAEQRVFLGLGSRVAAVAGWLVAGALAVADVATKIIFR